MLQDAFGGTDPSSELGSAILDSIKKLGSKAPPMNAAPGVGMQALMKMMTEARQSAPLQALMRSQGSGAAPAAGAAAPQAPPPAEG